MKTFTALAVIAALFAVAMPHGDAEAKRIKIRKHDNWKLSCNTARHMVRERGYKSVKIKSCLSTVYSFRAVRNGRKVIVYVHSRRGDMWQG
ncbi:MAG: hypothetical protein AB7S92_00510 [Parvibaculaceae bacterium]